MKTTVAGAICVLISVINIFFTFIPQPPLTLVMLLNAFFAIVGITFMVLGFLGQNAPVSVNVVEERNKLLLQMDEKNTRIKELERTMVPAEST
jgi:ABC-type bacteriocin/lantibiotic exporter with double-glycine peptidase domain